MKRPTHIPVVPFLKCIGGERKDWCQNFARETLKEPVVWHTRSECDRKNCIVSLGLLKLVGSGRVRSVVDIFTFLSLWVPWAWQPLFSYPPLYVRSSWNTTDPVFVLTKKGASLFFFMRYLQQNPLTSGWTRVALGHHQDSRAFGLPAL